ncbi:CRTAC1 family protein [Alloacidobacterium sp.]|uniref:CRTAC1 family protein n=1 Tax=Alloacidobacterium sp. TaxID=2951999 RepID=UPI002D6A3BBF|nr:CRTAC1 family protein [Alloacidobacterium sp.]HYK36618.1 CRTAC1 family protein [Alloacidobacterium sp.]
MGTLSQSGRVWSCTASLLVALLSALISPQTFAQQLAKSQEATIPVRYTNVTKAAGINFVQDSTQTDEKYYLETMGTGVGWLDYDQDGLMDLYFVQSAATDIYKPTHPLRSALYRNNGDGTFTDVTDKAGLGGEGHYGQGVAIGDFDNDGYPDIYVTGYGRAILYHNNGNGTFTDITAKAGVADEGNWSTSAGWFDYDKDGYLDLVVTNYIQWSPKNNLWCGERRPGYRSYCNPNNYRGQKTKLYHNNHDGTFTDVSDKSGVGLPESKGMGVVLADFNNDGWPDIAIANDTWPNFLFINNHDGTFKDVSLLSGIAASEDGKYEAGMGIDAADVDGDGWLDVYITHLDLELDRLYHNNGDGSFTDETYNSGIGQKAVLLSGIAAKFIDYDNDGWPDILQLNGAMLDNVNLYHSEVSYKEPLLMFRNTGKGHFEKTSDSLGPDFMHPVAGRGLATADYDNDGDIDIAVNVRGESPELLRNDGGNANHWIEVLLIGTKSNRDGTASVLKLTSEGVTHMEQAKGGMSYMSASDPRIHFGLGKRTKIDSLVITWPSGQVDKLTNVPIDKIIAVKEGVGIVPRNFPKIPTR